jgi:hypothetical protein
VKKLVFIFSILLLVSSCFKKKKYNSVPEISFETFQILGDSAKVTFRFKDGEGDIGLSENQTSAPYDLESKYHYNLYLVYYEKKNGVGFVPGKDFNGDSIVFRNRLKPIYTGKPKSLEGLIEYTIEPFYFNIASPDSDTILYKIQLIDRALNESQWIQTKEIIR